MAGEDKTVAFPDVVEIVQQAAQGRASSSVFPGKYALEGGTSLASP